MKHKFSVEQEKSESEMSCYADVHETLEKANLTYSDKIDNGA